MLFDNTSSAKEISRALSILRGKSVYVEAENVFFAGKCFPFWSTSGILDSSEVYYAYDVEDKEVTITTIYMQISGVKFTNPLKFHSKQSTVKILIQESHGQSESVN